MPDVFSYPILDSVQLFDDKTSTPIAPEQPVSVPFSNTHEENLLIHAQTIALTEDISGKKDPFATKMIETDHGRRLLAVFNLAMKYDGDVARAMKEIGYKNPNPSTLVKSTSFTKIMDHYFPLEMLAEKDLLLLNHPDWHAVNAALDRLHKLRGDFVTKVDVNVTSDKYRQLSDEDLQKIIIDGEVVNSTLSE